MTATISNIRFWIKNARAIALPQSMFPAILALCLAYFSTDFSLPLGLLSIAGVLVGHLGLNLFDDYFDYKKSRTDYRDSMVHEGFRARIGKCVYITSGKASLKDLFIASSLFSFFALFVGTIILYFRGEGILYLAILTAVLGISYSGAPLRFSYNGLGEILIGIIFGPLIMIGVFFSASGKIDPSVVLISIPVGLLVANLLYTHSILDFDPDKKIGKKTLAVLLNNKRLMLTALSVFLFSPFIIIVAGFAMSILPVSYLLTLFSLPVAIALFRSMIKFLKNEDQIITPRFWMGPMGDWKRIKAGGIDWFMLRWLLARNLLTFFCVLLIVANIISAKFITI